MQVKVIVYKDEFRAGARGKFKVKSEKFISGKRIVTQFTK